MSVPDLIQLVVDRFEYMGHIQRSYGAEAKERNENIQELKAYAVTVEKEHPGGLDVPAAVGADEDELAMEQVVIPKDDVGDEIYDPASQEQVAEEEDGEEVVMP